MPLPRECGKCGARIKNPTRAQNDCGSCKAKRIRRFSSVIREMANRTAKPKQLLKKSNLPALRRIMG